MACYLIWVWQPWFRGKDWCVFAHLCVWVSMCVTQNMEKRVASHLHRHTQSQTHYVCRLLGTCQPPCTTAHPKHTASYTHPTPNMHTYMHTNLLSSNKARGWVGLKEGGKPQADQIGFHRVLSTTSLQPLILFMSSIAPLPASLHLSLCHCFS